MTKDLKEASDAMIKLEEARIVMNRLLGPGGAFTEPERTKYLGKAVGAGSPEAQVGGKTPGVVGGGPMGGVGMTAPSQKAL